MCEKRPFILGWQPTRVSLHFYIHFWFSAPILCTTGILWAITNSLRTFCPNQTNKESRHKVNKARAKKKFLDKLTLYLVSVHPFSRHDDNENILPMVDQCNKYRMLESVLTNWILYIPIVLYVLELRLFLWIREKIHFPLSYLDIIYVRLWIFESTNTYGFTRGFKANPSGTKSS